MFTFIWLKNFKILEKELQLHNVLNTSGLLILKETVQKNYAKVYATWKNLWHEESGRFVYISKKNIK